MTNTDPFTLVYDFLHKSLIDSPALLQNVRSRKSNVVSLDEGHGQDQIRSQHKEIDLPEITLFSSTVGGNFNFCADGAEITRAYRLLVNAGTGKVGEWLFPLEWSICCALVSNNFNQDLRSITWFNRTFVRDVRHEAGESGDLEIDRSKGIPGWVAVWTITIRMVFSQAEMIKFYDTAIAEDA